MATLVGVMDPAALDAKQGKLFETLTSLGRVIVAYSGGTDSAYLAWAAHRVLGSHSIAITADSASIPESHKRDAEDFGKRQGRPFRFRQIHYWSAVLVGTN